MKKEEMKMGSLSSENLHAKRESVIVELVKGKESAIQLQTLLYEPVKDHGPVSVDQLAVQILRSFTETLSVLSSCTASTESAQISPVDGAGSACSGDSKKKLPGVKDRRGCYKRRKTKDSWIKVSPAMEDGLAWRKYGQKDILNSEYPRCYFRCTHKYDQGCKATKQVQMIKVDPILYQITYFNHHTCKETLRAPQLTMDSDPVEPNLISFQSNIPSEQDRYSPNPPIRISPVKEESKQDTQSEDLSDAKSSMDPWKDIIGSESLTGYKPVWDPIMSSYQEEVASDFQSCESTSLRGLDMEVNQLGDIDNFQYFDEIY